MPRKRTNVEDSSLELLRQFIRTKASLACKNYYEMQLLQSKVLKDTSAYLSVQTLSRFFSLVKNKFRPAADTLHILSQFVGYDSFEEFVIVNRNLQAADSSPLFHFITSLFSNMDLGNSDEKNLLRVLENIYRMLSRDTHVFDEIYTYMATTTFGRHYFFQKLVNMDALDGSYGDGVKYFLLHAATREEKLFGYCMLCQRYLLTGNHDAFYFYHNKVLGFSREEVMDFSPELTGRYFATHIYRQIVERKLPAIGDAARQLLREASDCRQPAAFPYIQYFLGEALILGEEYEEAWSILNSPGHGLYDHTMCHGEELLTQYDMLKLFSGFFARKIHSSRTGTFMRQIKSHPFHFLCNDYFSIYLSMIEHCVEESRCGQRNLYSYIQSLIQKTNFVHLYSLLDSQLRLTRNGISLMIINEKKIG